jgi:hypothetical protein
LDEEKPTRAGLGQQNGMRPCKLKSDEELFKHASLAQQNCNCIKNLITVW